MFFRSHLFGRAAYLAVLLASLAGCQTVDKAAAKLGIRKAPREPFPQLSELPSGKFGAEQKADVQMALARSLERQGATDQAINAYREVLRNDDSRADALHRLAVLYDRKEDFQTSEGFYRTALSLDPNNPDLLCDWGYRWYLQRDFPRAEASLRNAISLRDGFARAHNNLGLLLGKTGRCDEAMREFVEAGCSVPDARANLALALSLEGRSEAAREQFELALKGGSTSHAASEGLRALRAAGSETRGATQAFAAAAPGQPGQLAECMALPPIQGSVLVTDAGGPQSSPASPMQRPARDWGGAVPATHPSTASVPQWDRSIR